MCLHRDDRLLRRRTRGGGACMVGWRRGCLQRRVGEMRSWGFGGMSCLGWRMSRRVCRLCGMGVLGSDCPRARRVCFPFSLAGLRGRIRLWDSVLTWASRHATQARSQVRSRLADLQRRGYGSCVCADRHRHIGHGCFEGTVYVSLAARQHEVLLLGLCASGCQDDWQERCSARWRPKEDDSTGWPAKRRVSGHVSVHRPFQSCQ